MTRSAARVDDLHLCPLLEPNAHVGGPIVPPGATRTLINGKPAARVSDKADCRVALDDTVRGGLFTVFIDGNPASRDGDSTDAGLIIGGSPDVVLGEATAGPLTPFQVEWLYNYLDSQRNTIPFEYATEGCFARADRMASLIEALGIPVKKQWVIPKPGHYLYVKIRDYRDDQRQVGGVKWYSHVAPVVDVLRAGASPEQRVLDPSLEFGGPVSVTEWIGKQTTDPKMVDTFTTDATVYRPRPLEMGGDVLRDSEQTATALRHFRAKRAQFTHSTGRRAPDEPVHY